MGLLLEDSNRERYIQNTATFENIVTEGGNDILKHLLLLIDDLLIGAHDPTIFLPHPLVKQIMLCHKIAFYVIVIDRDHPKFFL